MSLIARHIPFNSAALGVISMGGGGGKTLLRTLSKATGGGGKKKILGILVCTAYA